MAHRLTSRIWRGEWPAILGALVALAVLAGILRMQNDSSRITLLSTDWRCTASHQEWRQLTDKQGRLTWQSEALCDTWARR